MTDRILIKRAVTLLTAGSAWEAEGKNRDKDAF
jgi:hypothetical protein